MSYTLENFLGKDPSHLVEVPEFKNCMLTAETAAAFKAMHDAAVKDGLNLIPVSSYRSFDRQLTIWNEKYLGDRKVVLCAVREMSTASVSAALTGADTEAVPFHQVVSPIWSLARLSTLRISMARVMGPTPPGTGVI